MAVNSETSRISYAGNNSTVTAYAVPFYFLDSSHVLAIAVDANGAESPVTLTDHTGAGNPLGGTVRTAVAVPTTSTLTIYREVPATQLTSYAEGGSFPAASHERALDKLTMIAQQNARKLAASLRMSESVGNVAPVGPAPNTLLGLNASNQPVAMTVSEVKTWLALSGVTLDVEAGMKTAANAGERGLAVPDFLGQLLTQRDTSTIYIATTVAAGGWTLILGQGVQRPAILDAGQLLASKLAVGTEDCVLAVCGDSTGNELTEWVRMLCDSLATKYPSLRIDYTLWDDATQSYPTPTTVQAGTAPGAGEVFKDLFGRTASDLYLTTPDVGGAWGRDGTNAAGDWTINGTQAVRSADTTSGTMLADAGVSGDVKLTVPLTISTTATGSAYSAQFVIKRLNSTNRLICTISVSTTGTVTWSISKQIAGTTSTVVSGTPTGGLSNNTASQTATLVFQVIGTAVTATLGAASLSGTLTAGDVAALAAATVTGVTCSASTAMRMDSWTVELVGSPIPQKLTVYNCSVPGSTTEYQRERLALVLPVQPDLVIASTGHNWAATTPTAWLDYLESFLDAVYALWPAAGIALTSQNPQKSPAANRVLHSQRQTILPSYSRTAGVGYIPTFEAWAEQPSGGTSLIDTDGVHPTKGTSGTGSSLWRDTVSTYLDNIRANLITSQRLADGAVTSAKIAANAVTAAKAAPGFPVQVVSARNTAYSSSTTTRAVNDTAPAVTDGVEIGTISITPSASSNTVLARASGVLVTNAAMGIVVMLFRGSTCIASTFVYGSAQNDGCAYSLEVLDTPATTSPVTYTVRAAGSSASGFYINGYWTGSAGSRAFGGTQGQTLTLTEIKA